MIRSVTISLTAALLLCTSLAGAWPASPNQNLVVCDRAGEQTLPKVVATSDGGCYVAWFDNGTANYDVYLQRLDAQGNPVWAHNGLLISSHTQSSSLVDWDLGVDSTNSAIIAFADMRNSLSLDVFVYRISPDEEFLWGADGIGLSAPGNVDFEADPRVCITSAGNVVIAWQGVGSNTRNAVKIRKLSLAGVDLWSPATVTIESTYGNDFPRLVAGDADGIVTSYVVRQGTSMYSPRHIYMQKLDASGTSQWAAGGVPVYVGNGVGFVTKPFLLADSLGGAYSVWYDSRLGNSSQHVWAQHILSAGTVAWTANGVQLDMTAGQQQMSSYFASRVIGTQDLIAFYYETDTNQSYYSVGYQRVSAAGARLWTDNGYLYAPLDARQELNISSFALGDGAVAVFAQYLAGSGVNSDVEAIRVDGNGSNVWATSPAILCNVASVKQRMAAGINMFGQLIAAWPDGRIDPSWDIYLQNVNPDGSLGDYSMSIDAPMELTAVPSGSDIELRWLPVNGATHYNIYGSIDPSSPMTLITSVTGTAVTLANESDTYSRRCYAVTAVRE